MISVIVLAYNAEAYISRCLNSLIEQTYRDFELIIINDGSTDNTLGIIRQFAQNDDRIVIVSRENIGVAGSRQEGLDLSRGEYSIFVDADDWVEPDYLEVLYNSAVRAQADMTICDIYIEQHNKTELAKQKPISLNPQVMLGQMLKDLYGSLWNKLISKQAYLRTNVRFIPSLNCCEDQYVVMSLLAHNISVAYCDKALYHYDKTININSITNNWLRIHVDQRLLFIKHISPFIKTDIQRSYFNDYVGRVAYSAAASPLSACANYRELFKEFKSQILQSSIPRHKKLICLLRLKGLYIPIWWIKKLRLYIRNRKNIRKNE